MVRWQLDEYVNGMRGGESHYFVEVCDRVLYKPLILYELIKAGVGFELIHYNKFFVYSRGGIHFTRTIYKTK